MIHAYMDLRLKKLDGWKKNNLNAKGPASGANLRNKTGLEMKKASIGSLSIAAVLYGGFCL